MSGGHTKLPRGRIVAVVIAVIVLVPVLFVVIGFWPGSTKDIEAVANKFQPGDGWRLESEQINPPMFICLQADCGEMHRSWKLNKNITTEEFTKVIKDSGWGHMIEGDVQCQAPDSSNTSSTGFTLCEVDGLVDAYRIEITATGNRDNDTAARIYIWIHQRR